MDCIKFAKIDFMKTLLQMKLMLIFVVIAFFLSAKVDGYYWAVIYLAFGGILMATTPFFEEIIAERGFFILLPAKAGSRMRGRYLFGTGFMFVCCMCGAVVAGFTSLYKKDTMQHFVPVMLIIFSIVLVCNSIQFLIFAFLNVKNAQVLSLIRMVIPFILFFIGNSISDQIIGNPEDMVVVLARMVQYIEQNIIIASLAFFVGSILITILCCEISVWREVQKER